jgi:hypothetical protein
MTYLYYGRYWTKRTRLKWVSSNTSKYSSNASLSYLSYSLGGTASDCVICPRCIFAATNSIPCSSGRFSNTVPSIMTHRSSAARICALVFSIADGRNTIVDSLAWLLPLKYTYTVNPLSFVGVTVDIAYDNSNGAIFQTDY